MIKIMKHRFLYIMALLLTAATGAWADDDPAPISLTSSADGTVWTLSTMPEYDVELEVTYKTDLTLTVSLSGWTYGATANTPTASTASQRTAGASTAMAARSL